MTVKELIEKLEKVENKGKEVLMVVNLNFEYNLVKVFDDGCNIILSHLYVKEKTK